MATTTFAFTVTTTGVYKEISENMELAGYLLNPTVNKTQSGLITTEELKLVLLQNCNCKTGD